MEKDLSISILLDFYGVLLTERQREIMTQYFFLDNSLSEIAEVLGISRQTVHDAIVTATKALEDFEKKLQLHMKYITISNVIDYMKKNDVSDIGKERLEYILDVMKN